MPSTIVTATSGGGVPLVSGAIFSGQLLPVGGVNLRLSNSGPGPIFVCLPNLSGDASTLKSGGTLTSGGLADGWELSPGQAYFISKVRLQPSGIESIRLHAVAASSGGRVFWELT